MARATPELGPVRHSASHERQHSPTRSGGKQESGSEVTRKTINKPLTSKKKKAAPKAGPERSGGTKHAASTDDVDTAGEAARGASGVANVLKCSGKGSASPRKAASSPTSGKSASSPVKGGFADASPVGGLSPAEVEVSGDLLADMSEAGSNVGRVELLLSVFRALADDMDRLGLLQLGRFAFLKGYAGQVEDLLGEYQSICDAHKVSAEEGLSLDIFIALVDGRGHGAEGLFRCSDEELGIVLARLCRASKGPAPAAFMFPQESVPQQQQMAGNGSAQGDPVVLQRGHTLQLSHRVHRVLIGVSWRRRGQANSTFGAKEASIEASAQSFYGGKHTAGVCKKLPRSSQVAMWHMTPYEKVDGTTDECGDAKADGKGKALSKDTQALYIWLEKGTLKSEAYFVAITTSQHHDLWREVEAVDMHLENADTGQVLAVFSFVPREKERNNACIVCRLHKHCGHMGHWQLTALGMSVATKRDLDAGTIIQDFGIAVCPPCDQEIGGVLPPESVVYDDVPLPEAYIRPVQLHLSPAVLVASEGGEAQAKAVFDDDGGEAREAVAYNYGEQRCAPGGVYAEPSEVDPCDFGKLSDLDTAFLPATAAGAAGEKAGVASKKGGDHDDQPKGISSGGGCCCCCDDDC